MKTKLFSFIFYPLLTGAFLFAIYIFLPRNYDVLPHHKLAETNFWNLPSGSTIGYTRIVAKGTPAPYPIIYLHGGPGGAITQNTIDMLRPFSEEGYDVYAYDQIGSGSSGKLDNIKQYTATRHTLDLEQIVDKVGAEKVILIGQSWGAVLATYFAVENPTKVEKIILTGPGPIFPLNNSLANAVAPDSLNIQQPHYSNQDGNKAVYTFRDKCIRWFASVHGKKLVSDEQADDFYTHLNNSLNKSTVYDTSLIKESSGGGGYYAHVRTLKSLADVQDPRKKMQSLKTPVLILRGQYDNQKWAYTQEYATLLKFTTLKVIPEAGHSIHLEQAELYYEEIGDFLNME